MNYPKKIDKEDKKGSKKGIKLKANDEAWGPPAQLPVIEIADKVERYLQQRTPN